MISIADISDAIDLHALYRFRRHAPSFLTYPPTARFAICPSPVSKRSVDVPNCFMNPAREVSLNIHLPTPVLEGDRPSTVALLCRCIGQVARYFGANHHVLEIHWSGDVVAYTPEHLALIASKLHTQFPHRVGALTRLTLRSCPRSLEAASIIQILHPDRIDVVASRSDIPARGAQRSIDALFDFASGAGASSSGTTLLFGQPWLTQGEFEATVEALLARHPDHVMLIDIAEQCREHRALTGQRAFASRRLALGMYVYAVERLRQQGYAPVAQNHFALAGGMLSLARMKGILKLQADGLTTRPAAARLAIGPGAVSTIGGWYYQNPPLAAHRSGGGRIARFRGWQLNRQELARRAVIQRLATDFLVDVSAIEIAYGLSFGATFRTELFRLKPAQEAGLVHISDQITLSSTGRLVAGAICMVFDEYQWRYGRMPLEVDAVK